VDPLFGPMLGRFPFDNHASISSPAGRHPAGPLATAAPVRGEPARPPSSFRKQRNCANGGHLPWQG